MSELLNCDALTAYPLWPSPVVIISDGAYGLAMGDWDAKSTNTIAEWYRPHIAAWSKAATTETTLWFWNTEIGWASVHPILQASGWIYRGCNVWNKGVGHLAGNVNTKTIRKFPVVTEVCVHYTRSEIITLGDDAISLRDWLRREWKRSGLPFSEANTACEVRNAASRKYLASDDVWYFPPPEAFTKLVDYANRHGDVLGRPYFSLDGHTPMKGSQWKRQRGKFFCPFARSNVWDVRGVRGAERIKEAGRIIHPNQKPISLMEMLIVCSSEPQDVIWDPFAGTATSLVACLNTGRKGYGAEFDPVYFDKAQQRLANMATASVDDLFESRGRIEILDL